MRREFSFGSRLRFCLILIGVSGILCQQAPEAHGQIGSVVELPGDLFNDGSILDPIGSDLLDLISLLPPTISVQPKSQTVQMGDTVTFKVEALGLGPFSYQWQKDGVVIPGETSPTLVLTDARFSSQGSYAVVVSNLRGRLTSAIATLSIIGTNEDGVVVFDNLVTLNDEVLVNAPVFDTDKETLLSGPDFFAQLYASGTNTNLAPVGAPLPFGTDDLAGYLERREILGVPGVLPGERAFVQVRFWETAGGSSFEEAFESGVKFGATPVFSVITAHSEEASVIVRRQVPPSALAGVLSGWTPQALIGVLNQGLPTPGSTGGVTSGPQGNTSCGIQVSSRVWYHITTTIGQGVFVSTAGRPLDTVVSVLGKTNFLNRILGLNLNPNEVACNDDMAPFCVASALSFEANETDYYVSVAGRTGAPGDFRIVYLENVSQSAEDDFNGDGRPDIVFEDSNGYVAAWLMNGFEVQCAGYLNPSNVGSPDWRAFGAGDFDNNGTTDLAFQHTDGTVAAWLMDGINYTTSLLIVNPSDPADPNWQACAVGHFQIPTDPTKFDIVFQHRQTEQLKVWLHGSTAWSTATMTPNYAGEVGWKIVGAGDFDGNTTSDLFFHNVDGRLAVWKMTGTTLSAGLLLPTPVPVFNPQPVQWRAVSATDLNRDGYADLVFQLEGTGSVAAWLLDGAGGFQPGLIVDAGSSPVPQAASGSFQVVAP